MDKKEDRLDSLKKKIAAAQSLAQLKAIMEPASPEERLALTKFVYAATERIIAENI